MVSIVAGRSREAEIGPAKDDDRAEGVAMHRRRLFALVASGLVLAASGCAGPARRAGMVGSLGGGAAMPRLIRPADPIARLSPAPVTTGPSSSLAMRDPGSYTRAGQRVTRSGPGAGGTLGEGSGMLSVGGGQLADRGNLTADSPRPRLASRPEADGRFGAGPDPSPGPAATVEPAPGADPSLAAGGWPVDDGRNPVAEAGPIDGRGPIPPGRVELSSEVPASGPVLDLAPGPGARPGPPPMLTAGIDLETYATPPVATDPDARLASGRRPIAVLRDALSGVRSGPTREDPEVGGTVEAHLIPEAADGDRAEGPALDPLPEPGVGPEAPALDDVRPAIARPDRSIAEEPAAYVDPHLAVEAPSPFEHDRPGSGILSRVRMLGRRLIPGRDGPGEPAGRRRWSMPRLGFPEEAHEAPITGGPAAVDP